MIVTDAIQECLRACVGETVPSCDKKVQMGLSEHSHGLLHLEPNAGRSVLTNIYVPSTYIVV